MENENKKKTPFNKVGSKKVTFLELVNLINQKCDYKFAIIDNDIDDELIELAKKEHIDLSGYKHVIETTGARHSQSRHGKSSADRSESVKTKLLLSKLYINDPSHNPFKKKASQWKALFCYRGGCRVATRPSRLDNPFVFRSVFRDQLIAKLRLFPFPRKAFLIIIKKVINNR